MDEEFYDGMTKKNWKESDWMKNNIRGSEYVKAVNKLIYSYITSVFGS
jgi:hypothetical protein